MSDEQTNEKTLEDLKAAAAAGQEEQPEPQPLNEPVVIEVNGAKLFYEFENLTLHQKELATEILRFKVEQAKKQPAKFDQVMQSGGAEYKLRLLSFLFVPLGEDGQPVQFKRNRADTDILKLIEQIKGASNSEKVEAALNDFFTMQRLSDLYYNLQEISSIDIEGLVQSALSQTISSGVENSNGSGTPPGVLGDSSSQENSNGD